MPCTVSAKYSKHRYCDVKVRLPSDWLPTFLSLANSSHLVEGLGLDGVDQTEAFRTGDQVGEGDVGFDF